MGLHGPKAGLLLAHGDHQGRGLGIQGEEKGRKSLSPKDKGPSSREARLAPACQDSQAAGNLHNILCKLISD